MLAQSSDEDDDGRLDRVSGAPSVRSKASTKHSHMKDRKPKSLVEELESVAETSGLCKRARKRAQRRTENGDDDNLSDSSSSADRLIAPLGAKRKVRFADNASLASTNRPDTKRWRTGTFNTGARSSDLWLVEANPETGDVLDLSDPRALARHTAIASDAATAKAMTDAFRAAEASNHGTRPKTSTPFPIVNGRIIIDESNKHSTSEPDWSVPVSDEEDEADANSGVAAAGWSHEPAGANTRKSKSIPVHIPGREFASSKARGDMRRPGQPDPYAYITLGAGLGSMTGKGRTNAQERRRLLKAVGIGRQRRKILQNPGSDSARSKSIRRSKKSGKLEIEGGRGIRRKLNLK
ncbi:unnamed protein product [Echinostoma caproni]|uniref:Uncharacterized protein n=1 Tax=Echinostoma caproni TaxID=27848 RepID=A0A3P8H3S0_9TREM|nr:unnamed protein product [Echinostoma caproni]